jgi:HAAS domain-containing protein
VTPVDRYLQELRRRLPLAVRSRVLAEVEDHLREAARDVGEDEAVARFGPAQALADSYRASVCWLYAALAFARLAYPVLSYPIPENALPPATWPSVDEMPEELVLGPLQIAVALGGLALLARAARPSRA